MKLDNSVNLIFGKISPKTKPKFVSNNTKISFKTYLVTQLTKKQCKKKNPKAITVLKKEWGWGMARYDHDHRFNGFYLPLP